MEKRLEMKTRTLCFVLFASTISGCAPSKPLSSPPVWSAAYNVPYTVMANCLAVQRIGGFAGVARIQPEAGVATVTLALDDGTQMAINFIVQRTGSGTSIVEWRRALTVGGWEPIDSDARARADACGKV